MCKGTSIKGSSDIDLVLLLANYREVRRLKDDLPVLLRTLHSCLEQFPNVTVTGETQYSVQIEYTCKPGDTHDVDVLLAVDAIQTCLYKTLTILLNILEDNSSAWSVFCCGL